MHACAEIRTEPERGSFLLAGEGSEGPVLGLTLVVPMATRDGVPANY
jgi:hypothetical protein